MANSYTFSKSRGSFWCNERILVARSSWQSDLGAIGHFTQLGPWTRGITRIQCHCPSIVAFSEYLIMVTPPSAGLTYCWEASIKKVKGPMWLWVHPGCRGITSHYAIYVLTCRIRTPKCAILGIGTQPEARVEH